MMQKIRYTSFILILVFLSCASQAQEKKNLFKAFREISLPEKIWVITHPFSAPKAMRVSSDAAKRADVMKLSPILDGDHRGGQVDAFRHGYWMASLSREINPRKARRLGYAHEKGNKQKFKKLASKNSEGELPDAPNCTMDLHNNDVGILIGKNNPDISNDSLQQLIVQHILEGSFIIIKKDEAGNFLDCDGKPIDLQKYHALWENTKCLVPSNFERPEPLLIPPGQ